MNAKIEVIMLTYNRFPVFGRSLTALLKTLPSNAYVTVCAQGCTDETLNFLQNWTNPKLNLLIESENIGLARYKELVERSTADIIVTCDDDVWDFSLGWETIFERVLFGDYNIGYICAMPINGKAGGLPINFLLNPIELEDDLTFFDCPCGGWFSATTRKVVDTIGGFPLANRSKFDLEDALFSGIVKAADMRAGAIEQVTVYHACSVRDKIAFGLAAQMIENAQELQKAGWISSRSLEHTIAEIEQLACLTKYANMIY